MSNARINSMEDLVPTAQPAASAAGPACRRGAWLGYLARRGLLWPVLVAAGMILVGFELSTATQLKLVLWLSFGLAALSLDLVWGWAGIFSFGQNALFGIGGYVYAIAALNLFPDSGETISAILLGALGAGLFAAVLGYVMFYGRVGDVYLSIVTLAVTLILYTVLSSTAGPQYHVGVAQLGGFNGMPSLPTINLGIPGLTGDFELGTAGLLAFAICLAAGIYVALRFLVTSKFGLVLAGLRENETRMDLLGYDVRFNKLLVFVIGGVIAGLGGGLFAAWGTFINPAVFGLTQAAMVIIWVMVGGRGSLAGAFLGVVVVQWVSDQADSVVSEQTPLILGVLLVLVVLLFPGGLMPVLRRAMQAGIQWLKRVSGVDFAIDRWPGAEWAASQSHRDDDAPANPGRLAAEDVYKNFGGAKVLNGVSLEFGTSRIHAIIGPNGAGKSTFFSVLTGGLTLSRGRVELNGKDVSRLAPFRRARLGLGIKLQVPAIFPGLTVQQNLELAMRGRRLASGRRRAERVLDAVGLSAKRYELASNLAHGQQQWLEIAMVLAQNPSVILLDEPAAGMTQEERSETLRLIHQLATSHTTIVVEHDMAFVQALRAPVAMLHQGEVFRAGPFEQVCQDPEVIDVYLGRRRRAASR